MRNEMKSAVAKSEGGRYLSIIIPAYNEGERIKKTLFNVKDYLYAQDFDFEVLIINDGSTDGSENEIKTMIKNWPKFLFFSYQKNQAILFSI